MTNWNQITRQTLYKDLVGNLCALGYKNVPISKIKRTLKSFFHRQFYLTVKHRQHKKVEPDTIYVGGCYFSDHDQEGLPCIQLEFFYNKEQKFYNVSKNRYKRVAMLSVDTLMHEIVHMHQYRSRHFKDIPGYLSTAHSMDQRKTQSYLGDRDEIGAYAFNLACELWDKFGLKHNLSIGWLDKDEWQNNPKSIYYDYMVCFDGDHDHPVIQRLKKKTKKYLTNYDIDRPFLSSKYLTY